MVLVNNDNNCWSSRCFFILALTCQTIGITSIYSIPNTAVEKIGATGYIFVCIIIFIVLGIPLIYLEFIVSQFTSRDCINVWKITPCTSHIGYFQIVWQIFLIIYNHILSSFLLHYFLITFEDPIPYLVCGRWATRSCNILASNYTVNFDCIKAREHPKYCNYLYVTFPEYQYWRNKMLGADKEFHMTLHVNLSSALITIILFLSCLRGKRSVRWCLLICTIYSMLGYLVLLVGSMQQKGLVRMYEYALDTNFNKFYKNFDISNMIEQILYALKVGAGTFFNLASTTSFRSPCYANAVFLVIFCCAFSILTVCITAMMACPYAFEYGTHPSNIAKYPLNLPFEQKPRLLHEYKNHFFWLLLMFSCDAALILNNNFVLLLNLIDVIAVRNKKVAQYPGLTCFVITISFFLITIPMLGNVGVRYLPLLRKVLLMVTIFLTMVECFVFVIWYGISKFAEDVHFMLGVPPNGYMKFTWMFSSIVLGYTFCTQTYRQYTAPKKFLREKIAWWIFICYFGLIICFTGGKLMLAAFRRQFRNAFRLDSTWGPNTDLLMRSRAMFSAQAMTKEYLYRQYHLQAGIYERQNRSNVRRSMLEK